MGGESKTKISKSTIFFYLFLSFLAGAFAASFFAFSYIPILLVIALAIGILVSNYKNKKAWLVSVAILVFIFGAWKTSITIANAKYRLVKDKIGSTEFTGTIIKEPEVDEKFQKIVVAGNDKKKILINADIFPNYEYGDQLKINCLLEEPKNYEDSRFDYQMYLAKEGIYRICNKPKIALVLKNQGRKIYSVILAVKDRFEEKISEIFPDPEGAYLKGLLLGGSKRMTENLNTAFQRTGTTHTVAVSGYNVTIVAAFLMWLGIFLGLWRQQVFSFALIGIVLFVLATGAPSSAVRAGIMGGLVIWAMKEGRLANSQNAILFAAAAMLLINPLLLRYDAGFQLSFLATLGIIYLYPLFEKKFFQGEQNILKETILMTLAAQVFVLPVILSSFENLSLISPLVNLLILPAIPYIMLGGFVAGLVGFIFIPMGKLIGFFPYILLKIELTIVQWLSHFSWSALEIKNFGWIHISVYYILLSSALFFSNRKKRLAKNNEK